MVFCLLCLFIYVRSFLFVVGIDSSGYIDDTDRQTLLDLHNSYRWSLSSGSGVTDSSGSDYPVSSNMNTLFWDEGLASMAQAFAEELGAGDICSRSLYHNSDRTTDFYDYTSYVSFDYPTSGIQIGENIAYYGTTQSTISMSRYTKSIDNWWNEHSTWSYQTYSSGSYGHFTQMIWAETRYVGCGVKRCYDGTYNLHYLVCNYYPAGNWISEYPYQTGDCTSSSNQCDRDRTSPGTNNMCDGCMDPSFTTSGSISNANDCDNGLGVSVGGTTISDPTQAPTQPTHDPTPNPTAPTPSPTPNPTNSPTPYPTPSPTPEPTPSPTPIPTPFPTPSPTPLPTLPTNNPTNNPTIEGTIGVSENIIGIKIMAEQIGTWFFRVTLQDVTDGVTVTSLKVRPSGFTNWLEGTEKTWSGTKRYQFSSNYYGSPWADLVPIDVSISSDNEELIEYNLITSFNVDYWDMGQNFASSSSAINVVTDNFGNGTIWSIWIYGGIGGIIFLMCVLLCLFCGIRRKCNEEKNIIKEEKTIEKKECEINMANSIEFGTKHNNKEIDAMSCPQSPVLKNNNDEKYGKFSLRINVKDEEKKNEELDLSGIDENDAICSPTLGQNNFTKNGNKKDANSPFTPLVNEIDTCNRINEISLEQTMTLGGHIVRADDSDTDLSDT